MYARDLMSRPPITCHVNDPLNVAAQRMWDGDIGMLAVVNDEGALTGVITDRDICMAAYTQGRSLDSILVNSAMASPVVRAKPDATLSQIEELMAKEQVRRIPIVDADNKPIGFVSLTDLAIKSVQANTSKLAHTLAAICRPRAANRSEKAA